jgi:hypothetical protein
MVISNQLDISTQANFYKDVSDQTISLYVLFEMMRRNGTLISNATSYTHKWPVYMKENPVGPLIVGAPLRFAEHDGYRQYYSEPVNQIATESIHDTVVKQNSGTAQIFDLVKEKSVRIAQAMQNRMAAAPYENASSAAQNFDGLDTFGTYTACTTTDKIARPNDTYGGWSTVLGTEPGTWSASLPTAKRPNAALANDYPFGRGSAQYHFNSPKFVNTESTAWPSGKAGFGVNSDSVLSTTLNWIRHTTGQMAPSVMFAMSSDHFAEFRDDQSPKMRIMQPHVEASRLGFGSVFNFEGSMLYSDSACPAGKTYALDFSKVSFYHYGPNLFQHEDQVWVTTEHSYIWKCFIYGNFRWLPKHTAFIGNFTA